VIAPNPQFIGDGLDLLKKSPEQIDATFAALKASVSAQIDLSKLLIVDLLKVTQELRSRAAVVFENGAWVPFAKSISIPADVVVTVIPVHVAFVKDGPDEMQWKMFADLDRVKSNDDRLFYTLQVIGH
jgi:hypothetical protein